MKIENKKRKTHEKKKNKQIMNCILPTPNEVAVMEITA